MINFSFPKAAIAVAASAVCTVASAVPVCMPMTGLVRLDPDTACTIASRNVGHAYLQKAGTCFVVRLLDDTLATIGTGHAGLTLETAISPLSASSGSTPAILKEKGVAQFTDEFGQTESRRFFTARSAIAMGTTGYLYTADAGVIQGKQSTEQLIVTGGTGKYLGASGSIFAYGNMMQAWARFAGKVCTGV